MLRKIFIWGNLVLFVLLILAIVKDTFRPWMPYQRNYRQMQAAEESAPDARHIILSRPIEIKQILATDLGQVDRCITCHQGMDSIATPSLENNFTENPLQISPGRFSSQKIILRTNTAASFVTGGVRSGDRFCWRGSYSQR